MTLVPAGLFLNGKVCRRVRNEGHFVGLEGVDGDGEDGDADGSGPETVAVALAAETEHVPVPGTGIFRTVAKT